MLGRPIEIIEKKYIVLSKKSFQESNGFLLSSAVVTSELFPDSGLFPRTNYLLYILLSSLQQGNAERQGNSQYIELLNSFRIFFEKGLLSVILLSWVLSYFNLRAWYRLLYDSGDIGAGNNMWRWFEILELNKTNLKQTSQELRMLSSVTLNCKETKTVKKLGSQLSE